MDSLNLPAVWPVLRAIVLAAAGLLLARLAARGTARLAGERLARHERALLERAVRYSILAVFAIMVLRELGFQLSVLLGAAGIVSVAVGFASQTSASNLISGLFLVGEKPFAIGDTIRVGDTTGEVLSVDLLSVKLRTFDNLFVRIPNEQLIRSQVTTLTRFPIRRLDLQIGVAYKEDLPRLREILLGVADRNPLCLDEPKPLYIFQGFGESSLNIQFSVWARRERFLDLRNTIHEEIKAAFDEAGVEIPFPHRSLYAGSVTNPFPVRIVPPPAPPPEPGGEGKGAAPPD